jgi:RND family efflux transporter MFP subunit
MKLKILLPVLILVLAGAIAAGLVGNRRQLTPTQPQAVPIVVRVIEVSPGPVQLKVHAQGTVSPRTETELVPEVSGNIVWISQNLVSGGYFDVGEPLFRIDDRDYVADTERASATLSRAQAEHEHASFEYERAVELNERQLISRSDLETNLRTVRVAEASLRDAQLVLESARRDLARTTMSAPFAGLVRSEQVDVGQFVNRGTAVASVYATDYVEVRLPIADQQLAYLNVPLIQRGELSEESAPTVELTADFAGERQIWRGRIVRTEAEIDPGSRMIYAIARVRAAEEQADSTIPPPVGLFVQAEIDGIAKENVIVLPRSALRNGNQVLVVDTENRLHFRTVEVLRVYRDDVFVTGGLDSNERVSVSSLQTVVEGMRVQPLLPES